MLLDELIDSPPNTTLADSLVKSTRINVQNVCDFYYQSPQEIWDMSVDFPNIAPPFPSIWMEWKEPRFFNMGGKEVENKNRSEKVGVLIESTETVMPLNLISLMGGHKWLCNAFFFSDFQNKILEISATYRVNNEGSIVLNKHGEASGYFIADRNYGGDLSPLFNIPFLSLSFMHCKNVTLEDHRTPSDKLNKSRVKNGKKRLLRTYTLKIDPMKKILKQASGGNNYLTKKSLHISRGHFKDFRNGMGLFGKHKDIYWWPMTVRGDSSIGEIKKDYDVLPVNRSVGSL